MIENDRVLLEKYLPGLFTYSLGKHGVYYLKFVNKNINLERFRIVRKHYGSSGYYQATIHQVESKLITLDVRDMGTNNSHGTFIMYKDLNLPMDACLELYKYNIDICYVRGGDHVFYDKEAILRKHTLNSIIA